MVKNMQTFTAKCVRESESAEPTTPHITTVEDGT
jgi:hypothetical protein